MCVDAVAVNLYQTSFNDDELETSQDAFAIPLTVAFAIVPDVVTQLVFGVSAIALEQLSFATDEDAGVEKFPEEENALVPLEQTVCT